MKRTNVYLTEAEVGHVAHLAKLNLTDEELKKFQKQLSSIVEFITTLKEVDTKDVTPTSQVTGLENVFRDDKVRHSLTQKEVLANAPSTYNGFIKVKAVLEE